MTHVTCRLTAKNRDHLRNLRSAIEYWLPLPAVANGRYRSTAGNGPITIAVRARFEYDSSAIQHPTRRSAARCCRSRSTDDQTGQPVADLEGPSRLRSPPPWATVRRRHGTPSCQLVLNFDRHAVKNALQNTQNDCHHAVAFSAL